MRASKPIELLQPEHCHHDFLWDWVLVPSRRRRLDAELDAA